jgi:hypothetical protein
MTITNKERRYEDDLRGMACCGRGRIGDEHGGCYREALHQQKRKDKR